MAMAGSGYDDQDGYLATSTATKDEMAVLSSEPVEPLVTPTFSDAIVGNNFLLDSHAPLAMETFEGRAVVTRLTDASDETVDLLDAVGTLDANLALVVSNDLNADSIATGDGQAGLGIYQAAEAEASEGRDDVGLAMYSILDELDPLEIPELRRLGAF